MFCDSDTEIFWDINDESIMANSILDIIPVFAQNDVELFFYSEPFADWTAEQQANVIEWDESSWMILASTQSTSEWNVIDELSIDFVWNLILDLDLKLEWMVLNSTYLELVYLILVEHSKSILWNILSSNEIDSIWKILNEGSFDVESAWNILTSTANTESRWHATTQDSAWIQWNLLNEIARDTSWRDLSATELSILWNIISLYSMDTQTIWNILADRSRPIEWRVRAALRRGLLWILRSETPTSRYILDELVADLRDFEFVASECEFEVEATKIQYIIEMELVEALYNEADSVEFEFKAMPKGGWS